MKKRTKNMDAANEEDRCQQTRQRIAVHAVREQRENKRECQHDMGPAVRLGRGCRSLLSQVGPSSFCGGNRAQWRPGLAAGAPNRTAISSWDIMLWRAGRRCPEGGR